MVRAIHGRHGKTEGWTPGRLDRAMEALRGRRRIGSQESLAVPLDPDIAVLHDRMDGAIFLDPELAVPGWTGRA